MAGTADETAATRPPEVTVRVPGLLARSTAGHRTLGVRAGTVAESVDRLLEAYPALSPYLLEGRGRFRPHVTLFPEGAEVAGLEDADVALTESDEVVVLQAVSGG